MFITQKQVDGVCGLPKNICYNVGQMPSARDLRIMFYSLHVGMWIELTLWLWISWGVAGLSAHWYQTMLPVWSCPRSPHKCFPQSPGAKSRGRGNKPNETGWLFKTNYSCWLALAQPNATYPKVEAVKRGVEIVPRSEAVHLHGHLGQKQTQEHKLCCVCFHKPGGD